MSEYDALKQKLVERANRGADLSPGDPIYAAALSAIRTLEERVGELERGFEIDCLAGKLTTLDAVCGYMSQLERDLAEARKDGERLEHLESIMDEDLEHMHRGVVYFRILVGPIDYGSEIHRLSDLSGAIDATREPEGDGPEELDYPPTPAERLEMADRARRVK